MRPHWKLAALCAAIVMSLPAASALTPSPTEIVFKYDASAPATETYRRAVRTASKACGLDGRVAPMKRALLRSCVRPVVEEFVIATGNLDLAAYHEKRTGRKVGEFTLVAN